MNTDLHLEQLLLDMLRSMIGPDAAAIGVVVEHGIAILTGRVTTATQKWACERSVAHVGGVRAIVTKLEVASGHPGRTDLELAHLVADALQSPTRVPHQHMTPIISDGWVVLEGMVQLPEQRQDAEDALCCVAGLRGVVNRITVAPDSSPELVQALIERGLWHTLGSDAQHVSVTVHDETAILSGTVRSDRELADAEWTAWNAPGIRRVENTIGVTPTM